MIEMTEVAVTEPQQASVLPTPTRPSAGSLDELAGIDEIKVELREQIRLWADPEPLRREFLKTSRDLLPVPPRAAYAIRSLVHALTTRAFKRRP